MGEELKGAAGVVVGQLIKAAGDDPKLKRAGQELASAALTVTKAVNVVLFPLAAMNYGFDRARAYFEERFRDEFAAHVDDIPAENVVMPKLSVAGPALQGLAFSHEETDLRKMYLNLLAASIDGRRAANVHPAFVEVIKQLTSREARLLPSILNASGAHPIVEINVSPKLGQGFATFQSHVIDLKDEQSAEPISGVEGSAMIDNWMRLGLVHVDYRNHLTGERAYDWVMERPEYQLAASNVPMDMKVTIGKGVVERTSFGMQFAAAVGMTTSSASPRSNV